MNKVSIIGAGNGGLTAAYHLSYTGKSVCLYDSENFKIQIDAIKDTGGIKAIESIEDTKMKIPGSTKIDKITTNLQEALDYSEWILCIVPSFAQEVIFEQMIPYLKSNHKIILIPGNFGSLVLKKIAKRII